MLPFSTVTWWPRSTKLLLMYLFVLVIIPSDDMYLHDKSFDICKCSILVYNLTSPLTFICVGGSKCTRGRRIFFLFSPVRIWDLSITTYGRHRQSTAVHNIPSVFLVLHDIFKSPHLCSHYFIIVAWWAGTVPWAFSCGGLGCLFVCFQSCVQQITFIYN